MLLRYYCESISILLSLIHPFRPPVRKTTSTQTGRHRCRNATGRANDLLQSYRHAAATDATSEQYTYRKRDGQRQRYNDSSAGCCRHRNSYIMRIVDGELRSSDQFAKMHDIHTVSLACQAFCTFYTHTTYTCNYYSTPTTTTYSTYQNTHKTTKNRTAHTHKRCALDHRGADFSLRMSERIYIHIYILCKYIGFVYG